MKKVISLGVCLLLLMSLLTTAYAVPDRSTTYMLQSILSSGSVSVGTDTQLQDSARQSVFDAVENKEIAAPIDWWQLDVFGVPVKEAAQALSEGDVEMMSLTSWVAVAVNTANTAVQDEDVLFRFVNSYPMDMKYVAVLGAEKDGVAGETVALQDRYDWQALAAKPVTMQVNGENAVLIDVTFTADALNMANGKKALVALFCIRGEGEIVTITEPVYQPSKTVDDMTYITIVDNNGIENLILLQTIQLEKTSQDEVNRITSSVTIDQRNVMDCFADTVKDEVTALLNNNAELSNFEFSDCEEMYVYNYTYEHGSIIADAAFPTVFKDGENVVVLLGVADDNAQMIWTPLEGEVVNGKVRITFTQNVLTRMEDNHCLLLVMSEKQDEV